MVSFQLLNFRHFENFFLPALSKKGKPVAMLLRHYTQGNFDAVFVQITKPFLTVLWPHLSPNYSNWCEEATSGFEESAVKSKEYIVARVQYVYELQGRTRNRNVVTLQGDQGEQE